MKKKKLITGFVLGIVLSGFAGYFLVDKVGAPIASQLSQETQVDWEKAHAIALDNFQRDQERLLRLGQLDKSLPGNELIERWGPLQLTCEHDGGGYTADLSTASLHCQFKMRGNQTEQLYRLGSGYLCSYLTSRVCDPLNKPLVEMKVVGRN